MPDLTIRIKKKTDGSAALSCTRIGAMSSIPSLEEIPTS